MLLEQVRIPTHGPLSAEGLLALVLGDEARVSLACGVVFVCSVATRGLPARPFRSWPLWEWRAAFLCSLVPGQRAPTSHLFSGAGSPPGSSDLASNHSGHTGQLWLRSPERQASRNTSLGTGRGGSTTSCSPVPQALGVAIPLCCSTASADGAEGPV